jgi:hypothetical protein
MRIGVAAEGRVVVGADEPAFEAVDEDARDEQRGVGDAAELVEALRGGQLEGAEVVDPERRVEKVLPIGCRESLQEMHQVALRGLAGCDLLRLHGVLHEVVEERGEVAGFEHDESRASSTGRLCDATGPVANVERLGTHGNRVGSASDSCHGTARFVKRPAATGSSVGDTIDGKAVAAAVRDEVRARVGRLADRGSSVGLATVLVGDDQASHVYVGHKEKASAEVGIRSYGRRLSATTTQGELESLVGDLGANPDVHGILVQLPLPKGLDPQPVIETIPPGKDVDGLHPSARAG